MTGRAAELTEIPQALWSRTDMTQALRERESLGSFLVIEQLLGRRHALRPYGLNKAVAEFAARLEECLISRLWLYQRLIRQAREFAVHLEESP